MCGLSVKTVADEAKTSLPPPSVHFIMCDIKSMHNLIMQECT